MTLDAAVTQPLIIKIAGVVQLDMYHISGLQKKSHLLFTGDAFRKILAHGLGDRLLITSMTSIIASSVSGGKAGGLHLGIGGRDLFVVAIFTVNMLGAVIDCLTFSSSFFTLIK